MKLASFAMLLMIAIWPGFAVAQHVAFSVEIRRDKRQSYSEIGGFFKEFGLSIIAADERDVIRVRTNLRSEDAYLYRVRMPLSAMRSSHWPPPLVNTIAGEPLPQAARKPTSTRSM